ncbi:hypothetical protein N0V85_009889, partial [Neurospora sp. IMI 360204]
MWLGENKVLPNCSNNQLIFPEGLLKAPLDKDIEVSKRPKLLQDPSFQEDVRRRERLMAIEDKRRADGALSQVRTPREEQEAEAEARELDVAIMELQAKTEDARKKNEEEKKKKEEAAANAKAVKEIIDKLEKQRKQELPPATKEEIYGRKCTETPKEVPDASWKPK